MAPEERKANSERILTEKGVGIEEELFPLKPASEVKLRSLDDICRRAIAALLSTQAAIELNDNNPDGAEKFRRLVIYFGVEDCLNNYENHVINNDEPQPFIEAVVWEYESSWALFWALGLVDDITDASSICDCAKAISFVSQCESYEDFKSHCKLRSADEILDMADLYFRYDWACDHHKSVDPDWPVGALDPDVVYERRLGLEWIMGSTDDWFNMTLNT